MFNIKFGIFARFEICYIIMCKRLALRYVTVLKTRVIRLDASTTGGGSRNFVWPVCFPSPLDPRMIDDLIIIYSLKYSKII